MKSTLAALKELPNIVLPLGNGQLLSVMQPITKMHLLHSYTEATDQLRNPFPEDKIISMSLSVNTKANRL